VKNPKSEIRNPNSVGGDKAEEEPKPFDLRERTLRLSIRILQITSSLPDTLEGQTVRRQLIRSGTSIGANVQEADGAVTRPDTRKSFVIAKKEAQETSYWLRIVDQMWGSKVGVKKDIDEIEQLVRILRSIIDRLR